MTLCFSSRNLALGEGIYHCIRYNSLLECISCYRSCCSGSCSCFGDTSRSRNRLVLPGLYSGRIYFIDTATDPRKPSLDKVRCSVSSSTPQKIGKLREVLTQVANGLQQRTPLGVGAGTEHRHTHAYIRAGAHVYACVRVCAWAAIIPLIIPLIISLIILLILRLWGPLLVSLLHTNPTSSVAYLSVMFENHLQLNCFCWHPSSTHPM